MKSPHVPHTPVVLALFIGSLVGCANRGMEAPEHDGAIADGEGGDKGIGGRGLGGAGGPAHAGGGTDGLSGIAGGSGVAGSNSVVGGSVAGTGTAGTSTVGGGAGTPGVPGGSGVAGALGGSAGSSPSGTAAGSSGSVGRGGVGGSAVAGRGGSTGVAGTGAAGQAAGRGGGAAGAGGTTDGGSAGAGGTARGGTGAPADGGGDGPRCASRFNFEAGALYGARLNGGDQTGFTAIANGSDAFCGGGALALRTTLDATNVKGEVIIPFGQTEDVSGKTFSITLKGTPAGTPALLAIVFLLPSYTVVTACSPIPGSWTTKTVTLPTGIDAGTTAATGLAIQVLGRDDVYTGTISVDEIDLR